LPTILQQIFHVIANGGLRHAYQFQTIKYLAEFGVHLKIQFLILAVYPLTNPVEKYNGWAHHFYILRHTLCGTITANLSL